MGYTLKFDGQNLAPVGSVTLKFGGGPAVGHTPRELTLSATLGPPVATMQVRRVAQAQVMASMAAPAATLTLDYDANVFRGPSAMTGGLWAEARNARERPAISWASSIQRRAANTIAWQPARDVRHANTVPFVSLPSRNGIGSGGWAEGRRLPYVIGGRWKAPPALRERPSGAWAEAIDIDRATTGSYRTPPRLDEYRSGAFAEAIRVWGDIIDLSYTQAEWRTLAWRLPWQQAWLPPYGESQPPDVQPPEQPPQYEPSTILKFCARMTGAPWILRFGVDPCGGPIYVPARRVYIVSNSASLTRVTDGADIPAQSVGLSIDVDSFAWSLRASLAGPIARQMIGEANGAPVEVDAHINGETWRVLIDGWSRSREFGSHTVNVTGRSLAAYLAAPYATPVSYTETQARLAQQLALRELPAGWTLDWQIADWLVPAGVWTYAGQTPIESIGKIAAAAGGYLQADMSAKQIHVLGRYANPYWEWSAQTPGVTLPLDVITQMGSDWQPAEDANAVYISGREQGVLVNVKRTGTAGNLVLPTVVDPLITDVDPARGRGTAELSATGQQSRERISLPLSTNIAGLIKPGTLAEISDTPAWRGLVRGTSVNAQRSDDGSLSVRQQIELERHYEAA